ncbi:zeta toxin family protein [Nocardia zapadnayensis]|uniref:zeta toxin family protein n=1 Tax=Nocardia rhamnosiphila TaxID=426716 RepID=UPI0022454303|nr:zeta toxin family protein [Nocardia zapadnayensis]MCX0270158.1 zeta toxin family protein [Nocardia zapadnayensis]
MRSPVTTVAARGVRRIGNAIYTASGELSRSGHEFADQLRKGALRFALSDHDMRRIFETRIVPEQLDVPGRATATVGRPRLVVALAQPGAGKSTAIRAIVASFRDRGGAVPLIADNYMRYHPMFAELRALDDFTAGDHLYPTAERWLDMAIDHVIAGRRNAVLEEGAGNPIRAARVIERFRMHSYHSAVEAVAVSRVESGASVLTRFLGERLRDGTGRYVPARAQDVCFDGSAELLRLLESPHPPVAVDEIRVRSRSGLLFENHRVATGEWSEPPEGSRVLAVERDRPRTPAEEYAYHAKTRDFLETLTQAYAGHPGQAAEWHRLWNEIQRVDEAIRT